MDSLKNNNLNTIISLCGISSMNSLDVMYTCIQPYVNGKNQRSPLSHCSRRLNLSDYMLRYNRILHLKPEFSLSTDFWCRPQYAVLHKYRSFLAMCANYITAKKPPLVSVWADHRYLSHRRQVFIQPTRHAIARDEVKPPFLHRRGLRDGNFSQSFFQPAPTDHHRNWVSLWPKFK